MNEPHKKNDVPDRTYATEAGFYLGDRVELPDGRKAEIDEIVLRNVNFQVEPELYESVTVVRLDDEYWLDRQLTRIA